MASLKFENGKCHGATAAKALMRHNDIDPESRKIAAKENPHIDVTKSHLNKSLLGLTYEQQCEKYDKRIAELDATTNKNKRKDRVTLQGIEVAVPEDLPRNCYNKFFIEVAKILIDEVGNENFIDGNIHYDEEHDYIDAETHEKTTSRVHCHFGVIPAYDGQLKAQKLYSRSTMRRLNKKVDEMSQREFGVKFMTGTKQKSRKTVDELKNESERLAAEQEKQQIEADKRQNEADRQHNLQLQRQVEKMASEVSDKEKALETKEEAFEVYKQETMQKLQKQQNEASNVLSDCIKLHENLKEMSKSYSESYNSKFIENNIAKLDSKLSLAYDVANASQDSKDSQVSL